MRIDHPNLDHVFEMEVDTKWLTIDTKKTSTKLRVRDAATASLQGIGADKLGLVMIHGQAKTGKSFLMNKLMDQPGFFAVRGGNKPTTIGVDLSPIKPYADFAGGCDSAGVGKIAFVDVEGQGDKGVDYDVMLTAPLLLVSKVVIFNGRGKMAKDEMLNKLGVLAEAVRKIKPEGNAKGDYRIFGHLHIILRDQPDVDGVYEALFEEEDCSATDDAGEARNKIRKIVRQSFASYRVWGFPAPIESAGRLAKGAFAEADTEADFDEAVYELQDTLAQQLKQPLVLCGKTLSAADIAEFVPLLAAAMNAGQKEIVPQSLFRQVEQRRADAAADAAIKAFDDWKKGINAALPMTPAALSNQADSQLKEGIDLIDKRLAGVSADNVRAAREQLQAHVDKSKAALALLNEKQIGLKVDGAKTAAFKELDRLAVAGEKREEPEEAEVLESAFEASKANMLLGFTNAIEDFKGAAAVEQGLSEIKVKAAATWEVIRRHNARLEERKQAAADKARLAKEKAAAEAKAATQAEAKKAAEQAKEAAVAAQKKAEEAQKQAEARAASAAGSCGGYGGGCGSGGGMSSYDGSSGYSSSSSSSNTGSSGGSSYFGPLYRQPAGTVNSRGSVSTGIGYTIDRNGRYHGADGRFIKNPNRR